MPTTNRLDQAFSFQESALRLRAERQTLLAANIANADTPNYKARDFDFNVALKKAVQGNTANTMSTGLNMSPNTASTNSSALGQLSQLLNKNMSASVSHPQHMQIGNANASQSQPLSAGDVQYRGIIQGSVDGNTVDMDMERNQFADNALRYEASINMINGQIKKMLTAIQGQ